MGLDMYLTAGLYLSHHDFKSDEEKAKFRQALAPTGLTLADCAAGSPHINLSVCVAYWRKANAIHKWFVDHIQKGVDDCGKYRVSTTQLQELLAAVESTLANRGHTDEVLQPQAGFFFGSTEIDEGYWQDMEDTKAALARILILNNKNLEMADFSYHSSW